jgi:hypothetical protein
VIFGSFEENFKKLNYNKNKGLDLGLLSPINKIPEPEFKKSIILSKKN